MSATNSSVCSIRACSNLVHGEGPRNETPLCRAHFDKEVLKLTEQKDSLLKKLRALRNSIDKVKLRTEQSALAAEVEEVSEMFDELQEMLQQWRQQTMARVQAVHDSVAERLGDAAEAEQCEKDLATACDAGDMRTVMKLTASAELWFDEASERSVEFDETRSKLRERQSSVRQGLSSDVIVRSVGDVAAGVQQLKLIINNHMRDVMQQCWLDDGELKCANSQVCESVTTIDNLRDQPWLLGWCSNTAGFGGDSSGRIVRAESSASGITPMPQPSIFISFYKEKTDHLLMVSLDGAVKLKYHSDLNWRELISGLHCDNERQLLYVAQLRAVTVTDLSGEIIQVITAESLSLSAMRVSAINGNIDKLFLLNIDLKEVHTLSKESGKLEFTLNVAQLEAGRLDEIALHGSKILLVDCKVGKVRRVCGVSGQLISSYPAESNFNTPAQVSVDSKGVLFVPEIKSHLVRVFSSSGDTFEILGVQGEEGNEDGKFSHPGALIVVKADSGEFLVVADEGNCRLRIFLLG